MRGCASGGTEDVAQEEEEEEEEPDVFWSLRW